MTLKLGSRVRLYQKKGILAETVVGEEEAKVIGLVNPSSTADYEKIKKYEARGEGRRKKGEGRGERGEGKGERRGQRMRRVV